MIIKLLVYVVIALLVLTKLADVISTLKHIRQAGHESNPLARKMMLRLGTRQAIWLIFLVALVIIAIAGIAALSFGVVFQVAFILLGLFVAVVQFAVAAANWTGRDNPVTRQVRKVHWKLRKILPG